MTKPFLLEIGLEEMPAHVVMPSIQQLEKRVRDFLEEQHLEFGQLKTYATPRRLAILIEDLADKQADIHEEAKGLLKRLPSMLKATGVKQPKVSFGVKA